MSNNAFKDTIETLLGGHIICSVSHPDLYRFMQGEGKEAEVNNYLSKMDKGVATTADKSGIYCVYNDLDDKEVKKIMVKRFKELAVNWEALLEWLKMSRELSIGVKSLAHGDTLRESELLAAIEGSSRLQDDLSRVLEKFNIKLGGVRTASERLTRLIEYLRINGFLVRQSESIYKCTARWSLLSDQLNYVRVQDNILSDKLAEDAGDEQEDLF